MLSYQSSSATEARKHFFELLEKVTTDHQIVVVNRKNKENVALIAESDLSSLLETAYLLKSPANARRLFEALEWSRQGDEQRLDLTSTEEAIAELKQELGLVSEETPA